MSTRRIIALAALGAALLGHFVARPIHRRARYVEAMRSEVENKCCTVGSQALCAPSLEEMSRLAEGSDAVAEAARKEMRACEARRERTNATLHRSAYRAGTGVPP